MFLSRRNAWLIAFAVAGVTTVTSAQAQAAVHSGATAPYHVAHRFLIGGNGSWDYLAMDTVGHRLFIARENRVTVVNPDNGHVLGEITGLDRAHGVAFAYSTGHGFATSGEDSTVVMFDLKTLKVLARTKAALDDDAVLFDPSSRQIFTFNGDAGSATVLNASTGANVGSIELGGKPEFGVSAMDGKLYVNIEDKDEVVEIDAASKQVTRRWSLAPCHSPSGLAIDVAHHVLFSVCGNGQMAISDYHAGHVVGTARIGSGVDASAFDPKMGDAFASNGDGTMTIVHEDSPTTFHVVQTVSTMKGARTMTVDPRSHRAYTASASFGPAPTAATPQNPHKRPPILPGTFTLLVLER